MGKIYDTLIIGSGVSGLYSAKLLKEKGFRVAVLEADSIVGGRTRQNTTFTQWPVELGGEMIHGQDTLYYELAKQNGWEIFEVFEEDLFTSKRKSTYFYLGRERKLVGPDQVDKDMEKLFGELTSLSEVPNPPKNENLLQHLVSRGVPFRMLGLADAVYSKTWGTNLDRIGLKQAGIEDKKYHKIPKNFKLQGSSKVLVEWLSNGLDIHTNSKVVMIDSSNQDSLTRVELQNGETILAKKVIVTVPLAILKRGDIKFEPSLPKEKQEAIRIMQMDGGMKIIAKFSHKFWTHTTRVSPGTNVELVLCGDSTVPQIWMDGAPCRHVPKGEQPEYVCVGFITGDQAISFAALSEKQQIRVFLEQLDAMFGDVTNQFTPASKCYISHIVFDWQKQPFVSGAYAFPCTIPKDSFIDSSPNIILSNVIIQNI
ncbi:putative amino oxidase [Cavenderia fasciculata]|uniref:Amino oxidase n=1 Tax=Cavenderia fasciculata TaxID=261658 RepID=F4PKZ6_CACFS|nr:putative amino oxidase [Cavenderia fasciculata]EGG23218.1 putative amino oxidase [Cavenderia fasciculata]|eukprot:XP_004361069.1 putative amino oxidase [Cavenderia fasciculata]